MHSCSQCKLHIANNTGNLALAMGPQAHIFYYQLRFGEAKSEAFHAAEVFEKLGDTMNVERCREFTSMVEMEQMNSEL